MRNRHTAEQQEESAIDLTPMLDVVFIMLIFFIVTTSFVKETGIEVSRPSATTAQPKGTSILIGIRDSGEVWIGGHQVDMSMVRATVERLLAQSPEDTVVIVADEGTNTGVLVDVLDAARLAGAESVSIAAERDRG